LSELGGRLVVGPWVVVVVVDLPGRLVAPGVSLVVLPYLLSSELEKPFRSLRQLLVRDDLYSGEM
jgi:hypothetical protein